MYVTEHMESLYRLILKIIERKKQILIDVAKGKQRNDLDKRHSKKRLAGSAARC